MSKAEGKGPVRVVILGGGFAGVHTAKCLTELAKGVGEIEVELLSEENYFVFQPLLPEVAAGGIAATHVVNPIREMIPRARFRCCKIIGVDFDAKQVLVHQGDGLAVVAVEFDHLVFCLGKVTSFAAMPGAPEHAFAMKDLSDAFELRNHVLACLEQADIEENAKKRRRLLSFVVAGGGFSGVETMGELQELVSRSLRYFPRIQRDEVRFTLVHSGAVLLPEMKENLGKAAQRILEERGVEVVLKARVRAATSTTVYLQDGRLVPTSTFVCTVGNAPNPIVKKAIATGGFEEAKVDGRGIGAFAADASLACVGRPGYWAVGDCAGIPNPSGKGLCPPTAQFAIREAKTCAKNILATIQGRPVEAFDFKVLGMLASLGQRAAVADLLGVSLTGFVAWFLWRTVYLMKLPGIVRRLRVMIDWSIDLFFPRDITQLQVFRTERLQVRHYEPGEVIVEKGDIGRELYLIVKGEVEVVKPGGGKTDLLLSRLGDKDVFGERALLEDAPRNATCRAVGPVDVVVMTREDLRQLVRQLPVLAEYFSNLMRERHPQFVGSRTIMETMDLERALPASRRVIPAHRPLAGPRELRP
ncbi:MAG: FAD-dependent oxidoreductase [Polyangiaceae bacterium]